MAYNGGNITTKHTIALLSQDFGKTIFKIKYSFYIMNWNIRVDVTILEGPEK
jgi:hypothetical protein